MDKLLKAISNLNPGMNMTTLHLPLDVKQLVSAINQTRPEAIKHILDVAQCDFCGNDFAIQPQDKARIIRVRARFCCWQPSCRKVLRKAQNQEAKLVNPEAT